MQLHTFIQRSQCTRYNLPTSSSSTLPLIYGHNNRHCSSVLDLQHRHRRPTPPLAALPPSPQSDQPPPSTTNTTTQTLVGEDAAFFDLSQQSLQSWGLFFALLSGVSALLFAVWVAPGGLGLGQEFISTLSTLASDNSSITIILILAVFALIHSGLAYLRPYGEQLIGARPYRVVFALASLPLAVAAVVFFINHRYDGIALWNIRGLPFVHEAVWGLSFISFYLLYPSTFNILEVAAVDEPKLHMWETGVMRITRHPQFWGQLIWCMAHTAWIGSSFMMVTTMGLMAHHAFGIWHGDYRLKRKYGEAFEEVKARTSVVPFAAMLDGRQKVPGDYWKEWVRLPYLFLVPFCLGAYFAHPLMQQASYYLGW